MTAVAVNSVPSRTSAGSGLGGTTEHPKLTLSWAELAEYARDAARSGGCTRPVRLVGGVHAIDLATGERRTMYDTATEPGGVLLMPCSNRRETVCPPCSQVYKQDAVRDGYIRKTPCADIRLPEIRKTIVRLLTPAQVVALADAMQQRYALLVLLGAGAGLRQGEAFGLALDRIDITAGMITIDRQVVVVERCPVLAPPKTSASLRDVPMPRFLMDAVADHSARLKLGASDVLCRTPRGTLLRRDYYNHEIWKPAITVTGLPGDTTFHDLRHTFASTALAEGVPISEVSRWLGHKSITTTVDLYGHLVPEASGRARDALDNAFRSARVCPQSAPAAP